MINILKLTVLIFLLFSCSLNDVGGFWSKEKDLKNENDKIAKTKNVVSEEELKKKVNDFRKKVSSYENKKKEILLNLNKKRKSELNNLLKLINPIIQNYMEKNSIDVIIDKKNIYIAKSDFDITNDILELINNVL